MAAAVDLATVADVTIGMDLRSYEDAVLCVVRHSRAYLLRYGRRRYGKIVFVEYPIYSSPDVEDRIPDEYCDASLFGITVDHFMQYIHAQQRRLATDVPGRFPSLPGRIEYIFERSFDKCMRAQYLLEFQQKKRTTTFGRRKHLLVCYYGKEESGFTKKKET